LLGFEGLCVHQLAGCRFWCDEPCSPIQTWQLIHAALLWTIKNDAGVASSLVLPPTVKRREFLLIVGGKQSLEVVCCCQMLLVKLTLDAQLIGQLNQMARHS
jgi:hypothetical protein